MELVQYIYTSTCSAAMTAQNAYDMSSKSVSLCEQFGITGRVFANRQQALAMTEGPKEIVERYYQSVCRDPYVFATLLHVNRIIPAREFNDYSVWLNLGTQFEFSDSVRPLTADTVHLALPDNPSPRLRIMAEAYLDDDMLIAV